MAFMPSWKSDISPRVIQRNMLKGLALAAVLHLAILFVLKLEKTWVPQVSLKAYKEIQNPFRMQVVTFLESGGGQGGGEGGGSLAAPMPEQVPAIPIPVPDALAPVETVAVAQNVSPALDSANAGGTGLPGSSWGTGGTGWGVGQGPGVGLVPVVVVQPRPLFETLPEYPSSARKAKIQGEIQLHVKVDESGKVVKVTVMQNTTRDESCAQAAVAAAYRTRFRPAQTQAGPDTAWVIRRYSFSLNR
jgi:TonB family protein